MKVKEGFMVTLPCIFKNSLGEGLVEWEKLTDFYGPTRIVKSFGSRTRTAGIYKKRVFVNTKNGNSSLSFNNVELSVMGCRF